MFAYWGSSVSIVPDYRRDDWATGVRSLAEDFSSRFCAQRSSEAHPASCPMGTVGPFPGGKARQGVTLTTHPHIVPWLRISRSCISSLPCASMAVAGQLYFMRKFTNQSDHTVMGLSKADIADLNSAREKVCSAYLCVVLQESIPH
jgi:hypothetical protein